jgi:hypothetical protein
MLEFKHVKGPVETLVQSIDGKRIFDTGPSLKHMIDKPLKMLQKNLIPLNSLARKVMNKNGKSN